MEAKQVTSVSGSKLGRFLECPSSVFDDGSPAYNPDSEPSQTGTAAHAASAEMVLGREPNIAAIAHDNNADPAEVGILLRMAARAWDVIKGSFPEPRVEVPLTGVVTHGRCDVLHTDGETLAILDWDFGWLGTDKLSQLRGYADAARQMFGMPKSGVIQAFHVHARKGTATPYRFDPDELDMFRVRVQGKLDRIGKDYGPSHETCRFCPRQLTCQARADYARASVTALVQIGGPQPLAVSDAMLTDLYTRWKEAKRAVELFDKLLGERLKTGPLPFPDGRTLVLGDQEREEIDALLAWPILEAHLTPAELSTAIKVGKTAVLDAVKAKAERGKKGRIADALMDELRGAGAVTTKVIQVRQEVKP